MQRSAWKEQIMIHFVDILIVAAIGLALFGPKALQSMARSAGKGVGQAKDVKDKLMAELPVEDFASVAESLPQVPLNSRQAVQMLLNSDEKKSDEKKKESSATDAPGVKSETRTERASTKVSESEEQ
jgi:Sec-independent protein translocase protein TatA